MLNLNTIEWCLEQIQIEVQYCEDQIELKPNSDDTMQYKEHITDLQKMASEFEEVMDKDEYVVDPK